MSVPKSCERSIKDVVEKLRVAKQGGVKCTLLLGAGCSISAGIPGAVKIVADIQSEFPQAYWRAQDTSGKPEPGYAECMEALDAGERRMLFDGYIQGAKINWAHIAVAQLMKEGYIDRVVTTNFDNVQVRACALVGLFPAVYDLTLTAGELPFNALPTGSILYLHGQGSGFSLKNTAAEVREQVECLGACFNFGGGGRTWIVVGYSGENDPVFDVHLAGVSQFFNSLYWVGYKEELPAQAVCDTLFTGTKQAFRVKGHDADDFFCRLGQQLECFPPKFVSQPFSYLQDVLRPLAPYPLSDYGAASHIPLETDSVIQEAITKIEPRYVDRMKTQRLLMAAKYDELIASKQATVPAEKKTTDEHVFWAYIMQGNDLYGSAQLEEGEKAKDLFRQACDKYQLAIKIKPDKHEAFYNWGNVLAGLARMEEGDKAKDLFRQACDKFQLAIKIKPDSHEAFYNWGIALAGWARLEKREKAKDLFRQAIDKYQQATQIKSDKHEAFKNWGSTLMTLAPLKEGKEVQELFRQAVEKLQAAERIKTGSGAYNLACVAALTGDVIACRIWMKASLQAGALPSKAHLERDTDLNSVRSEAWFQEFMQKAYPNETS